jgi:hypothetical protein
MFPSVVLHHLLSSAFSKVSPGKTRRESSVFNYRLGLNDVDRLAFAGPDEILRCVRGIPALCLSPNLKHLFAPPASEMNLRHHHANRSAD